VDKASETILMLLAVIACISAITWFGVEVSGLSKNKM
jgi:hypothetical protein